MSDEIDGVHLARYLAGECSPEEATRVRAWIDADPARVGLIESLRAVWELTGRRGAEWDVDRAWRELVAARKAGKVVPIDAQARGARPHASAPLPAQRTSQRWAVRAAAAAALLVGGSILWQQLELRVPGRESVDVREYATQPAEQGELRLPDGSRVVLAPASRLRLAANYDHSDTREVFLEGQGLFEVEHDPARPFRVHSGETVTEVLGTRFVVRAYAEDSTIAVALAEGKVEVRQSSDIDSSMPVVLAPGQIARVDARGRTRVDDGNLHPFLLWVEGRLIFEDTPLGDAVRDLGRWYDLDIRLADAALAERRLTASFGREPVAEILELIALSLNLRHVRDGRTVTFFAQ